MEQRKILIVDDEPDVVRGLIRCFQDYSYEVLTAQNGLKGLDLLRQQEIDLAFVDWRMPRMNGLRLLRKARREKIQTAIVLMTGFGSLDLGVKAIKAGAVDAVEKPLGLLDVRDILTAYMPPQNTWQNSFEAFLEQNHSNPALSVDDVLRHFRISNTTRWALFKKHVGTHFRQRLREVRLTHAEVLVRTTELSISEIAYACGFRSLERLCDAFTPAFGCSPRQYRKKVNAIGEIEENRRFLRLNSKG